MSGNLTEHSLVVGREDREAWKLSAQGCPKSGSVLNHSPAHVFLSLLLSCLGSKDRRKGGGDKIQAGEESSFPPPAATSNAPLPYTHLPQPWKRMSELPPQRGQRQQPARPTDLQT